MKKVILLCIMLILVIASYPGNQADKETVETEITHIELTYSLHLKNTVIIADEQTVSELVSYIGNAHGQKSGSTKGVYGFPYILTLYFKDGSTSRFWLWDAENFSTSSDTDDEEVPYLYHGDMSELYEYMSQKFPV